MSLNKYSWHSANIDITNIMLDGHMGQTFLHIYAKWQPTTMCTLQNIAKYVPETNMATEMSIYIICTK